MASDSAELHDWVAALREPLPKDQISLRLGQVSKHNGERQRVPYADGTKATFLAYHDARDVMDRLDEVVGIDGWRDEYTVLTGQAVACRLSVRNPDDYEWVTKEDVGYPNDPQKPEPEALKSAYSDALKRVAVKFGVGRYLYSLPDSGWWPINKWGDLSKTDEAMLRKRMFDGLAVEPPGGGDPVATGPAPEPEAARGQEGKPGAISEAQRRTIWGLARSVGLDSDGLHALMKELTGRESSKDLANPEITKLIDALKAMPAVDDSPADDAPY